MELLNNIAMKRLVGIIASVVLLSGCAQLPLVSTLEGTLSVNGAIAGVTGKYEHQAASAVVNMDWIRENVKQEANICTF